MKKISKIKLELLKEEFIKQIKDSYTLNLSMVLLEEFENLQQENARLKENNMSMQKEMARTWEKADLYKEVIEEVSDRITIKLGRYINEKDYVIDDVALDELLQILDKVKD